MDVYRGRQRVTYTIGQLSCRILRSSKMVMVDAEMAVGHLSARLGRDRRIGLSELQRRVRSIDTNRKLVTFLSDFRIMIGNWNMVRNRATELNRAF